MYMKTSKQKAGCIMATKAKNNKNFNTELEQALFSDRERFEMWIAENWKKVAVAAVLAALVTAGGFSALWHRSHTNRRASYALVDAADADLEKTLKQYPDAPGAALARMRLAQKYAADKKYDDAIRLYRQISGDSDTDETLRNAARLAVAATQENAGSSAEAASSYSSIAQDAALAPDVRGEAGLAAARLLAREKKLKEAAAVLQNVIAMAGSPRGAACAEIAKNRLVAIENGEFGPYQK